MTESPADRLPRAPGGDGRVLWYSFDVFETLIVRSVINPSTVFGLLGQEIAHHGLIGTDADTFANARLLAGQAASRGGDGFSDPAIHDIYRELALLLRLSEGRANAILQRELALERRLARPNPVEVNRVEAARDRGRILFLSDMYLPSEAIRTMLEDHRIFRSGDVLVVSAEASASKRSGRLFRVVPDELGCSASDLRHRDNEHSHVVRARAAGWSAQLASSGNATPDEGRLGTYQGASGNTASQLGGAARLARLSSPAASETAEAVRNVAAAVAAPVLIGYTLWVLTEAANQDIERLYFVAREGQILFEIATRLAPSITGGPTIHYLYGSRLALNLPAIHEPSPLRLAWALTHASSDSPQQLAARCGLTSDRISSLLQNRLRSVRTTGNSSAHLPWLLEALSVGELARNIETASSQARVGATHYLSEIGFLEPGAVGVVDTTGVGSQLWALKELRTRAGYEPATGFLVQRMDDHHIRALGGFLAPHEPPIVTWLEDAVRGRRLGPLPGGSALLELLCWADHGHVTGYDTETGEPRLSSGAHLDVDGRRSLAKQTILSVADEFRLEHPVDPYVDLRRATCDGLHRFWTTPTRAEAEAWGSMSIEASTHGELGTQIAPPLRTADLATAALRGHLERRQWHTWRAAAILRSAPHLRLMVSTARLLLAQLRRLRIGRFLLR